MSVTRIGPNVSGLALATEQTTTSGTAFDFTGIPSGVKRVTVMINTVSLSGTDNLLVQLGDSGGFEVTGYDSSSSYATTSIGDTTGFTAAFTAAGNSHSGHMVLTRVNDSHLWVESHSVRRDGGSNTNTHGGGDKTLSGELTQIRVTRSGTNTFDAGSINIMYE